MTVATDPAVPPHDPYAGRGPGSLAWIDLTVPDAEGLRDFYAAVVGWRPEAVDCGAHDDYNMLQPGTDVAVAGVCHARGINADVPPVWLPYVLVADLDASLAAVRACGGAVLHGPRPGGDGSALAVIRDPAGACMALIGPTTGSA